MRGPPGLRLGDFVAVLMTSVPEAGACGVNAVATASITELDSTALSTGRTCQVWARFLSAVTNMFAVCRVFRVHLFPLRLMLHTSGARLTTQVRCPSTAGRST